MSLKNHHNYHSTETALLKVTNDLLIHLGAGFCSCFAGLNRSFRHFDTNHDILLNRLKDCVRISSTALKLSGLHRFPILGMEYLKGEYLDLFCSQCICFSWVRLSGDMECLLIVMLMIPSCTYPSSPMTHICLAHFMPK